MIKILVPIKRVIDFNVRIRVKADGSGVETAHTKMSANPFDEIALEEAVRLKEAQKASEVVVVSIGLSDCQETLRAALALGADRAILVHAEGVLQPLTVAKLLKQIVAQETPELILMGKQAIDDDCNQTGQMLAALLGCSQATFASKIEMEETSATVTREVDGGLEILRVNLPAVITVDLRLNQPRYPSLPNIMKAKQKKIELLTPQELGVSLEQSIILKQVTSPPTRKAGIKVASVQELLEKLRDEAKVL